jgi:homoserine dehydrogenase
MIEAAFGQWLAPETISTRGIDGITGDPKGYKLIVRARRDGQTILASVAPELPPPESFLAQSRGAENRIEIELESGKVIKLCGQGAGRWPTAVSVVGDLHAVARLVQPPAAPNLPPLSQIQGLPRQPAGGPIHDVLHRCVDV